jgi:hypothetical protein
MTSTGDATPASLQDVDRSVEASTATVASKGQISGMISTLVSGSSAAFEEIGKMLQASGMSGGQDFISGIAPSEQGGGVATTAPDAAALVAKNQGGPSGP